MSGHPYTVATRRCRLLGLALALVLSEGLTTASLNAADEVIRHSTSTPVRGTVTGMRREEIVVKPRIGSEVRIPANDVLRVRWDGEPPQLRVARNLERTGKLNEALKRYEELTADVASGSSNLQADLEFLIARTKAKLALTDESQQEAAIRALESFIKNRASHFRYFEALSWLGQVQLAADDFAAARSTFDLLSRAPFGEYKMEARLQSARIALKQGQLDDALAGFDEVLAMPANSPAEKSRHYEAMLGKSACLIQQQSFEKALEALQEVIAASSPQDTRVQAEAYLRQGDCLQALGRTKEAVLAYLKVDLLFPGEPAARAEALYHLSRLWGAVGHGERGEEARAALESEFPNSEWTRRLAGAAGS